MTFIELTYLSTLSVSDGKAQQIGWLRISFEFDLGKCSGMSFNWLTYFPLNGIQLHSSDNPILLYEK